MHGRGVVVFKEPRVETVSLRPPAATVLYPGGRPVVQGDTIGAAGDDLRARPIIVAGRRIVFRIDGVQAAGNDATTIVNNSDGEKVIGPGVRAAQRWGRGGGLGLGLNDLD